ncbi:MAG: zinc ribbon domain-containing protein [Patescibacteria group bacterium]|nr:zinc ribbon domain-containing protein [Patescibacteria group bacterium]MDD5567563.1 zinc ribbon domain-containing protein [Patescibacteria group bacterium]
MIDFKNVPICQSCSLPLVKEEDFGTNSDGGKNEEYCNFCFQKGQFTEPNMTKDEMVKRVAEMMPKKEGSEEQVRFAVDSRIRNLRRWQ